MNVLLGYWYRLYVQQTECEQILEKEICKLGIRYRTQHPFLSCQAIVDFYLPDYNLVVEVDDKSHREKKRVLKDAQRTEKLKKRGIEVVRFTNEEVRSSVSTVLQQLCGRLGVSPLPSRQKHSHEPTHPKLVESQQSSRRRNKARPDEPVDTAQD